VTLFRRKRYDGSDAAEPDCGFATLVRELDVRYVPGDHRGVLKEPHVRTLAQEIRQCIDQTLDHDRAVESPQQSVAPAKTRALMDAPRS
jgi:thioesterase domain-containing protein